MGRRSGRTPGTGRAPDRVNALSVHGRAVAWLGVASAVGIASTALFQLVTIRGLGPEQYGLLAAFLAIVNVMSVGSGALRNSVAVATAAALAKTTPAQQGRRIDPTLVEALVLGLGCTLAVVVLSPIMSTSLSAQSALLLVTAATAVPYFLFSRAQGVLQGLGATTAVAWWSTGAQAAQFVFAVIAISMGQGALGILAVMLCTAVIGAIGSSAQARRSPIIPAERPFTPTMMVILLITVLSAWLANADVVLARAGTDAVTAGAYSAGATLIKTTLLVPSILSLYLLPRFVARRHDARMTRTGVNATLLLTLVTGIAVFVVSVFAAPLVIPLFGRGYEQSVAYLPWLALTAIPWGLFQAVLIRLTAAASRITLAILAVLAVAQWVIGALVLPDVYALILVNGCVGLVLFAAGLVVHLATSRHRS